jgi:hypothetical protein
MQKEDVAMRKPRDFDAEMKMLNERARQLKERKVQQLGELVIACRTDALPVEQLAGALLIAAETIDRTVKEGWRDRGAAFFRRTAGRSANGADRQPDSGSKSDGGATPASGTTGAQ